MISDQNILLINMITDQNILKSSSEVNRRVLLDKLADPHRAHPLVDLAMMMVVIMMMVMVMVMINKGILIIMKS